MSYIQNKISQTLWYETMVCHCQSYAICFEKQQFYQVVDFLIGLNLGLYLTLFIITNMTICAFFPKGQKKDL